MGVGLARDCCRTVSWPCHTDEVRRLERSESEKASPWMGELAQDGSLNYSRGEEKCGGRRDRCGLTVHGQADSRSVEKRAPGTSRWLRVVDGPPGCRVFERRRRCLVLAIPSSLRRPRWERRTRCCRQACHCHRRARQRNHRSARWLVSAGCRQAAAAVSWPRTQRGPFHTAQPAGECAPDLSPHCQPSGGEGVSGMTLRPWVGWASHAGTTGSLG